MKTPVALSCAISAGALPAFGLLPTWAEMLVTSAAALACYMGGKRQGKIIASKGILAGKILRKL